MRIGGQALLELVDADAGRFGIDGRTRDRARELIARAPRLIPNYYELRIGPDADPQVDLFAVVLPSDAEALREQVEGERSGSAWSALARVCAAWRVAGSRLHAHVPLLTVEFDDIGRAEDPQPSLALCLDPAHLDRRGHTRVGSPEREQALMRACLLAAYGSPREHLHARLDHVARTWPRPGAIVHFSLMLGRDPLQLKLYGDVPRATIASSLRKLGWGAHASSAAALVEGLAPAERVGERLYLDLDLDQLSTRLGLVFAQQQLVATRTRDHSHRQLLAELAARGWVDPTRATALAQWAATIRLPGRIVLRRWLDLKLVWRPHTAPELKAYLGFGARADGPLG